MAESFELSASLVEAGDGGISKNELCIAVFSGSRRIDGHIPFFFQQGVFCRCLEVEDGRGESGLLQLGSPFFTPGRAGNSEAEFLESRG